MGPRFKIEVIKISQKSLVRENLRVTVSDDNQKNVECIEILEGDKWIPILRNIRDHSTLLFWSKDDITSKLVLFERRKKKKLYYGVSDADFSIKVDYCLEESDILHIKYNLHANRDMVLSRLAIYYEIVLETPPDFTWVPHIRPKKNLVIGDHVFRSPVIIYKKKNLAFALIPDLKTLGQNRPVQSFLDFNLNPDTISQNPYVAFGFGNYQPYKHVFFRHSPKRELDIKEGMDLTFRYYIISFSNKSISEILAYINNFFWLKYIRRNLYSNLEPQVLPYELNVKESFKAIFERHKYWGNLKVNNVDCGGFWGPSWLGKEKLPLKFIKKEEIEDYLHTYSKRHRIAVIFNTAWFLNIRSAYGIRYFGELWNDKELIRKGNKMLNLILELPRINGVFPSIILPNSENSSDLAVSKGMKAWWHIDYYNLVDIALAMCWTIRYSQDFETNTESVTKTSKELVDLLKGIQLVNGSMPVFINFDEEGKPKIIEDLIDSASSGAFLMFLVEYYKLTKDVSIIPICEKICDFIEKSIIPENKWHDFEVFYSCTYYSLVAYDYFTNSNIMNNLSIYWCAEGFLGVYRITNNKIFIETGERILATLSLFQQVWDMSYINYNTFGGFGCQNDDAELGDAREALFVNSYMQYYLETGKEEYMERAIAALRASWTLQLLEEYRNVSPGNLKGIDTVDTIDKGCISENYGHSGRDERIDKFVMFDWGNGTATTATALAKNIFGDLFIDFKEKLVWGIDGVLMKEFNFDETYIEIKCEFIQNKSNLILKGRNIPKNPIEIILNGISLGSKVSYELDKGYVIQI
ncbi:MAG: hypothetical protein ACFE9R_01960 [Candidatus Hermodarchaeota archaeon]